MIDYLVRYNTFAAAKTALAAYGADVTPEGGGAATWQWDGSYVLPTTVWLDDGTKVPGYFLWISRDVVDESLAALPQMLEIDRETRTGSLYGRAKRARALVKATIDRVVEISPVWMGADYGLPGRPSPVTPEGNQ